MKYWRIAVKTVNPPKSIPCQNFRPYGMCSMPWSSNRSLVCHGQLGLQLQLAWNWGWRSVQWHIRRRGFLGPLRGHYCKCISSEDTYQCLGVKNLFVTDDKKAKDSVIAEYRNRLQKIWKFQLNSCYKDNVTNILAMSLLRYLVTVKWTRRKLRHGCACTESLD